MNCKSEFIFLYFHTNSAMLTTKFLCFFLCFLQYSIAQFFYHLRMFSPGGTNKIQFWSESSPQRPSRLGMEESISAGEMGFFCEQAFSRALAFIYFGFLFWGKKNHKSMNESLRCFETGWKLCFSSSKNRKSICWSILWCESPE